MHRLGRAYFLFRGGDNIVAEVMEGTQKVTERIQDDVHFDDDWLYVQVANDLYCLEDVYNDFCVLKNFNQSGYFEMEELAPALNDRFGPALCNL